MAKFNRKRNDMPNKTTNKTERKKMSKRSVVNAICIVFLSICVIGSTIAFVLVQNILSNSVVMEGIDGLYSEGSTEIYDKDGELLTTLSGGDGVRENISYQEIPQVVIDSFLAIEDSRYFKHSGFDLPRFLKSGWVNLTSGGIAQGGSTLTMQLVDVKLFTEVKAKEQADGILKEQSLVEKLEQKVVEIFKSMDIEARLNKEQILEYYLNSINFGGPARGIQKGAQYYFGKDAKNLNLSEAAFLAGVINAPGSYNPYIENYNPDMKTFLTRATERRNAVLYQLNNHGYITDSEYKLALSTDLSLQLNGETAFSTDQYASALRVVINEAQDRTGKNPYTTPMKIYTTISRSTQELADKILDGELVNFPDERIQTGFTIMNNQTGEVLAIGGGRGYTLDSNNNHGAYFEHQVGSTSKPLIAYAPAFDDLGYSTEQTFADTPVDNYADGKTLYNADRQFHGDVTFKDAVGWSYNIPAYKTFKEVVEVMGVDGMISLMNKMGFDNVTKDDFSYAMSIGGGNFSASTLQLSEAYSIFANEGKHIDPYTIKKIDFEDDNIEDYEVEIKEKEVFSDEAAYLMSYILRNNITQKYPTINSALSSAPYPVYAKSGTSDAPEGYAIPAGAAKDKWIAAYTNQYTTSVWLGYEDYQTNPNNYLNDAVLNAGYPEIIARALLDDVTKGSAEEIKKPAGVVSISHVQGYGPPYASANGGNMVTGLIRSKFAKVSESISPDALKELSSFDISLNNNVLTIKFSPYSDTAALSGGATKTVSAGGASITYTPLFSMFKLFGAVQYKYELYINGTLIDTVGGGSESVTRQITSSDGDEIKVCGYYGYEKADTTSNKICKSATSNGSGSFTIGTDFDALFASTSTYDEAVAAVKAWAESKIPGVSINFVKSENVAAGKNDTAQTEIIAGQKVSKDKTYIVAIGTNVSN